MKIFKDSINNIESGIIKFLRDYSYKKIGSHFTRNAIFNLNYLFSNGEIIKQTQPPILKFLLKHNPNIKKYIIKQGGLYYLSDYIGIFKININTYAMVKMGKYIYNTDDSFVKDFYFKQRSDLVESSIDNCVSLTVFGKHAITIIENLKVEQNEYSNMGLANHLTVYNVHYEDKNMFVSDMTLASRSFDSLFYADESIKSKIIDLLEHFKNNGKVYKDRNLIHKTGILLYGEPGTGKSTLCNCIASYLGANMIIIDMSNFHHIDLVQLTQIINADNDRYVVVLEDIDCIIKDRNTAHMIDKEENKVINKLLQFLDSNNSPNNVVFVATTNHFDKLDTAITRKGRFDLVVKVNNLDKTNAINMCKSFGLNGDQIDKVLSKYYMTYDKINQSDLQATILSVMS